MTKDALSLCCGPRALARAVSPNGLSLRQSQNGCIKTVPALVIDGAIVDQLVTHALHEHPDECCGLLMGCLDGESMRVVRAIPVKNMASGDRNCKYQLDGSVLLQTLRCLGASQDPLVGFYHSHPDGSSTPSDDDRQWAWRGYCYLIIGLATPRAPTLASWYAPTFQSPFLRQNLRMCSTAKPPVCRSGHRPDFQ